MPDIELDGEVLARLRSVLTNPHEQVAQMLSDRDGVHRTWGRIFHPDHLDRLSAETFKSFLLYENNRHWWGIHRYQQKLVADVSQLKRVLSRLLDESEPIAGRVDWIEGTHGTKPLKGLGKAVYTPILHVVYPDRYGVWNSIAENAMRRLDLWPSFAWGETMGQRYEQVNRRIGDVAAALGVDRWTIDTLWWRIEVEAEPTKHQFDGTDSSGRTGNRSSAEGPRARARSTFMCSDCYQQKADHLESPTEPGVCSDCKP